MTGRGGGWRRGWLGEHVSVVVYVDGRPLVAVLFSRPKQIVPLEESEFSC